METIALGEIVVKEGVPQCPRCGGAMGFAGSEKHPSGTDMPIWRCAACGSEFPPGAARTAAIAAWRQARNRRRVAIAATAAVLAAIAAVALL